MKTLILIVLLSFGALDSFGASPPDSRFVALSYNIHYWQPTCPNDDSKTAFKMDLKGTDVVSLFAKELKPYHCDVISLQESVNPKRVEALAKKLGMNHVFFPGGWQGKGWPQGIAGALLTRHTILESTDCPLVGEADRTRPKDIFTRHLGRILIDTGKEKIAVYSTHLLPYWENTEHIRFEEIKELKALIDQDQKKGHEVILMGDFNLDSTKPEYQALLKTGLIDSFASKGTGPSFTCPTEKPAERIDYIWISKKLSTRLNSTRHLHEGRFALTTRTGSYALSDHIPVLTTLK